MKNNIVCETEELTIATKEEQMKEATRRLNLIVEKYNLHPKVLKRWQSKLLCYSFTTIWGQLALKNGFSFSTMPKGIFAAEMLRIPRDSQYENIVRNYEEKTGCMVYHALQVGPHLSFLFVSPYKEDWFLFDELENPEGVFEAYVHNLEYPQCSEHGETRLSSANGALIRIE